MLLLAEGRRRRRAGAALQVDRLALVILPLQLFVVVLVVLDLHVLCASDQMLERHAVFAVDHELVGCQTIATLVTAIAVVASKER